MQRSEKADEYRRKSAEAEEMSREATDSYMRESYAEIARGYRALADQFDRRTW